MASSFEKSVKGATKIKAAPPKTKYIEHILIATHAGEAGVGEVFRALQHRLRDSTWTVVFKSLITVHLMIREGSPDVTLAYLAKHRNILAVSMFSDAQTQGRNIRHYSNYLSERARAYRDTKCDWVRGRESRLEKLSIEKGLLRETEVVQHQLTALLKCDVMDNEPENEITITVFRLLVLDLTALFQILNQAMINILSHFFEMSKVDAERAMGIYRNFTKQTDFVVQYLSVARQYEHHTRVEVPKLKHAPVNLGRQLDEYLKDPDFEVHRRQYLAELDAKKKGGSGGVGSSRANTAGNGGKVGTSKTSSAGTANGTHPKTSTATHVPKPQEIDLMNLFDSLDQNQTTTTIQPGLQAMPQPGTAISPWGSGLTTTATSNAAFQVQPTGQFPMQPNGFATQPTGVMGFQATNPFQQQNLGVFSQQQQQQPQQPQQQASPHTAQSAFTGASFGGYTPQSSFQPTSLAPIPQDTVATFPAPSSNNLSALNLQTGSQTTNPFRQSMLMTSPAGNTSMSNMNTGSGMNTGMGMGMGMGVTANSQPMGGGMASQPASSAQAPTNPFARSLGQTSPFQSPPPVAPTLQPLTTGTNPFARSNSTAQPQRPATSAGALLSQPTGSTNPFRQSNVGNQTTGLNWQQQQQQQQANPSIQQTTGMGGHNQFDNLSAFARPTTAGSPWQA